MYELLTFEHPLGVKASLRQHIRGPQELSRLIDWLESHGWEEDLPLRRYWRYFKGQYSCYIDFETSDVIVSYLIKRSAPIDNKL